MHPVLVCAAALLVAPCVPHLAHGQAPSPPPGSLLRVTMPCERMERPTLEERRAGCRAEGRLVRWQTDSLTLAGAGSTASYGLHSISRLEVSQGRRSHWLVGAGTGLVLGAGVTFVVLNSGGSTSLCDRSANQDAISPRECLGLVALGGVAGAGLGGIVGGLVRTERWRDVPLDRLRVGLRPKAGRGPALAVAMILNP